MDVIVVNSNPYCYDGG